MSLDRNSPCPCGSGRKYKRCCLRRDADSARALHLIGADPGPRGERGGPAQYPAGPVWQADIVPLGATFDNDHGARPVVALVSGNGFILHSDILANGPSEPADVAAAIANAVDQARGSSADAPRVIEVRFASVGEALASRLRGELDVRVLPRLDGIDDAAFGLQANVMGKDRDPRLQASSPATWKGWGFGDDRVRRLFAAAASYHRAAPWEHAGDDETIQAAVPGGGTWYLAVLGGAGETFGLAAYASLADLEELFGTADGGEHDQMMRSSDAIVSLTFGPSSHLPRPMRQEIRAARWDVVGEFAYPLLMVLNTPGGGITARQADDLIAILRDVPSFLVGTPSGPAQLMDGTPEVHERVRFEWVPLGTDDGLWPLPATLAPASGGGAGADPLAIVGAGGDEEKAIRADAAVLERFSEWLATPVNGKVPADSTITRHMRPARALVDFMVYTHGARLRAVSELDLRVFLYDWVVRPGMFGDFALGQMRGSLRRFFAFLDECEGIECPWAAPILGEADAFEIRRATRAAATIAGVEDEWRDELTDDLVARVLLPASDTDDGVTWGPRFSTATAALYRELMRHWLVWRDEAIASGQSEPHAVSASAIQKQVEWQRTVHPALGMSPADALVRANQKSER